MFNEDQLEKLLEPLTKENVKQRDGTGGQKLSYIASHYAIDEANSIFGFDGWSTEILSLSQIDRTEYEKPPYKPGDEPKKMVSVSYLCTLRLTVKSNDRVVTKEDTGFGNGVAGYTAYGIGSCIELASKEAVTDALKRCLRYFGNKFGNSLYDKDSAPLPDMGELELSKPVTEEQLKDLRNLYDDRGIDDEWVIEALKAEKYDKDTLESMNNDWYQFIFKLVERYKADEIAANKYQDELPKLFELLEKPANMNMLKAVFKEIWTKATANDDKETQKKSQEIYNKLKKEFEESTK